MNSTGRSRRNVLKGGAALAGLAAVGVRPASAQAAQTAQTGAPGLTAGGPDPGWYDPNFTDKEWPANSAHPDERSTPQQDLVGIITPNHLHFMSNHRDLTPNINAKEHRLLIHGMVDRPIELTMADLKRMPSVSRVHYVACAANGGGIGYQQRRNTTGKGVTAEQTDGMTACSEWSGVLLSTVLEMVGVQKGANWMVAEGLDAKKHAMDIPMSKGMSDAFLAYGQNGEPVRPEQGYPLRLIVPGFEGTRNVKWLGRIKVTDRPYWTYYENVAYHNLKTVDGKARNFQYEMEPGGVITFPSGTQQLSGPGYYEIRGIAWSGGGSVRRVEISTDFGKTWKDAELQGPVHRIAHTKFVMPWKWDGSEVVLMSRTTDDNGDIQPTLAEFTKIWKVNPDYWQNSNVWVQHFNACVPWKIDRDGMVTSMLWDPSNNI